MREPLTGFRRLAVTRVEAPKPLLCPTCDGDEVQALLWVSLKRGVVVEDGDDFDTECFCPTCDEGFRFSALRCV